MHTVFILSGVYMDLILKSTDPRIKKALRNATMHVGRHVDAGPLCYTGDGITVTSADWFAYWKQISNCDIAILSEEKLVVLGPNSVVLSSMIQKDIRIVFRTESELLKFILTWG